MDTLPLAGLRVLVTRPSDQAGSLTQAVQHAGGTALLFPLLDISPVIDTRDLREKISRLSEFDLAIFISPNAVQYGMVAIAKWGATLPPQVATIGAGSARALRTAGVASVIAPTERFDSEGLLALPELAEMAGKKVMILRGDGGRELLADTLKARGATVEYVTCYQRAKTSLSLSELLQLHPDVLTVTSSEALAHLRGMSGDHVALLAMPLFVPHTRIADAAKSQGWQDINLTAAGDEGLISGLLAWRCNAKGTS